MEHLKCYGAQEMVRYLCHSIARPHWLMDSRCRKDYPCVRVSSSYRGIVADRTYPLKINCREPPSDALRGKRLGGDNIHLL